MSTYSTVWSLGDDDRFADDIEAIDGPNAVVGLVRKLTDEHGPAILDLLVVLRVTFVPEQDDEED